MSECTFCVEYSNSIDHCVICTKVIERNALKIGVYQQDNQEETDWNHFRCFWTDCNYEQILRDEDPDSPSFEGYIDLKSVDKQKIVKALKKFQNTGKKDGGKEENSQATSSGKNIESADHTKQLKVKNQGQQRSTAVCNEPVNGPHGKFMYLIHEDSKKYLKIKRTRRGVFVSVIEYYWNKELREWFPTNDGVNLSIKEWEELAKNKDTIDKAIVMAERALDEPTKKKRKISGVENEMYYCGDWETVTCFLSEMKTVCVRTVLDKETKYVVVGFPYYLVHNPGKNQTPSEYMTVSMTTEEWANMMQLRKEVNDDLVENFDVYYQDI